MTLQITDKAFHTAEPMTTYVPDGTGVAIIAPGGYAPDEAAVIRGISLLEQQGCRVKNYYQHHARYQRFGADDASRAAQLMAAAVDPEIQIIMALRGAYGMSRILPALDFPLLANSGKLFVGYSDVTALHLALLAQTQTISFSGPMLSSDFGAEKVSAMTIHNFWQVVTHKETTIEVRASDNPVTQVRGILWGGNLTILTHLLSTSYFPEIDDGILFLEDVNEHPYRIERMLLQLKYAGVLNRQRAILLGNFSAYRLSSYDNGYDFEQMLRYLRQQVDVPILTGLPFGHIHDRVTLPVGALAELTSTPDKFSLSVSGYPTL